MDAFHHNGEVAEVSDKLEKSLSMDTDDRMETYHRLIQDGKDVARDGDMHKALECFKLAYKIHQSQKLESRIKKIEDYLAQNDPEEDNYEFVNVNNSGLMLFKELHDKLYDYQRNGIAFLYSLYRDGRKGGILADDMGLGKTIQVISFLSGMYDNKLIKHTLLVMPTSLITNWTKEFAKWTPVMRVKEFHGASSERTRNLEKVQRRGGVIITTYAMLIHNWQQLSSYHDKEFTWDYVILDEAHKIKSPTTKTAKSASAIPSKNRILLTGTPVQNNLGEMWALFDFACQGSLLGTAKTFRSEYENPITRAREKDATPGEKALGSRMSENLMAIVKPYFLRRTKSEVQKNKMNCARSVKVEQTHNKKSQNPERDSGAAIPTLTRKNDLIIWTYLSTIQEEIYRQFLSLDHIKELLMTTRSPLAELTILKKLCDHPRLLSAGAIAKLGLAERTAESQHMDNVDPDSHSIANVPDDALISESGKLVFLFALLDRLRQEGHRTLVFAHYRKVLDIIERILGNRGFKVLRLDGTITQIVERERLISLFQRDERYSVFLLTTQVGGVGITLTAATRVVIYDPSWNPATDAQAVDRAYRIGQTKNVVIYRLITCGTVEEKIYRRQVFKDSLIRQNTGDKKNPFRYFSKQELKELFTLENVRCSSTQLQLQTLHSRRRWTDPELDEHIAHLHAMDMFGISDHDLMFSLEVNQDEAPENQEEHQYIEGRVQKAQELMKAESELQMQLAENMSDSTEPAWLRQPTDSNNKVTQPSPSQPQNDSNFKGSPAVVDVDQPSSDEENRKWNESNHVIDLTVDERMRVDQPAVHVNHDKLRKPMKQEMSNLDGADTSVQEVSEQSVMLKATYAADVSGQELLGRSVTSEAADVSGQELLGRSVTSEAADVSGQELLGRSVTSEAADVSGQELLGRSVTSEAADVSGQELLGRSVTSEAADVSGQELLGRSVTSEAADVSGQELLGRSVTSEAADVSGQELLGRSVTSEAADVSGQELLGRSVTSEAADVSGQELLGRSVTSEAADVSGQELLGRSVTSEAAAIEGVEGSLLYITSVVEQEQQMNRTSQPWYDANLDLSCPSITPLKNKRLSVFQASNSSFKADSSSRVSTGVESFEGNFNLQLEDSDMFSDQDVVDDQASEAEERKLLSQLQMDGTFDVDKSLSEMQHREALGTEMDESVNDSVIIIRKKRVAVIYDSEEEEGEDERQELVGSQLENSFKALGASTPKPVPSLCLRRSIGGNTSVASRLSLLQSIIQDQDMIDEEEASDDGEDSEKYSDEAGEEDIIGQDSELQLEETTGVTINTEEEEDIDESGKEMSSNLELSTSEPELKSTERMEQCTIDSGVTTNVGKESESYQSLVCRGRQSFSQGKLDDALGFFLRAIDIQPGDPEIQLMTIQLYRQLSQRT